MNWNRFSLFKLPNHHKRFEYVPRYFDAEKEALRKKLKAANLDESTDEESVQRRREITFKTKTASRWNNSDYKSQTMRSNVRLIVILAGVVILFYYIFQGLDGMGLFIDEKLNK